MNLFVTILFLLACLVMIGSILLQQGKSAGMSGSIGGGAEQIFGKSQARKMDSTFDKVSKIAATSFILLALLLVIIQ